SAAEKVVDFGDLFRGLGSGRKVERGCFQKMLSKLPARVQRNLLTVRAARRRPRASVRVAPHRLLLAMVDYYFLPIARVSGTGRDQNAIPPQRVYRPLGIL